MTSKVDRSGEILSQACDMIYEDLKSFKPVFQHLFVFFGVVLLLALVLAFFGLNPKLATAIILVAMTVIVLTPFLHWVHMGCCAEVRVAQADAARGEIDSAVRALKNMKCMAAVNKAFQTLIDGIARPTAVSKAEESSDE